ncbi:hypothetical protein Hypma_002070 [Hypsizygus marmoreus]|uniref:Uncharacterized protein n=1 Tax=Hypsizygus marmoreus TaxID=39966 RepID=A0A369K259_HYPMA|nr:hypothetical protein Hypma_002070 [Hypsizygus marmoreus]
MRSELRGPPASASHAARRPPSPTSHLGMLHVLCKARRLPGRITQLTLFNGLDASRVIRNAAYSKTDNTGEPARDNLTRDTKSVLAPIARRHRSRSPVSSDDEKEQATLRPRTTPTARERHSVYSGSHRYLLPQRAHVERRPPSSTSHLVTTRNHHFLRRFCSLRRLRVLCIP